MHYVLLTIALLLGLFGLYKFFLNARPAQIKSFLYALATATITIALFFMAVTGRLAAAIGLVVALIPLISAYLHHWKTEHRQASQKTSKTDPMTKEKALEILGLEGSATEKDIKSAHKKLMKKLHPDQEGSDWLAAQINEARDYLLSDKKPDKKKDGE